MINIAISLNINEVNAVITTLGNLPTHSGVFPLLMKIKAQAEGQIAASQRQAAPDGPAPDAGGTGE